MEREAQEKSSTLHKHDSSSHEAHKASPDGKVQEPPPIAPIKGQEHEAVLVAPDDKSVKPDRDAKGVAGRKKYKGGEHWDVASGKQAAVDRKKTESEVDGKAKEEEKVETEEEHEVEVELNAILKKGPSTSHLHP